LITVLWVWLPATAGAQSANGKKSDSSLSRQLQANPGRSETRSSVKVTPDRSMNSFASIVGTGYLE